MKTIYHLFIVFFFIITPGEDNRVRAQSWTMQHVGFHTAGSNPFQISIVNNNVAWCTGAIGVVSAFDNEFSRTLDGGSNWQRGTIPMDSTYGILSVTALDALTAFVVTTSIPAYGSTIYKTLNGGQTWTPVDSGIIFAAPTSAAVNIHLWTSGEGVVTGDPVAGKFEIYTTADSGNTWTAVMPASLPAALPGEFTIPKAFDYQGSYVRFGTSKGRVFTSPDHGHTWTVHAIGLNGLTLVSFLSDNMNGIAEVYNGSSQYRRTSDGGITWSTFSFSGNLYLLFRSIPGTGIFVSFEGEPVSNAAYGSSYSTDLGNTWIPIDTAGAGTTNGYGWMEFLDLQTGWAGGTVQDSLTDGIYKWNPATLGMNDLSAIKTGIYIYPNPAEDFINVSSLVPGAKLDILDINGKVMFNKSCNAVNGATQTINLQEFRPGIYFIKATSPNGIKTGKFIVR